ncbi:hypothetical protein ARMGADRAFT_1031985 [Armillaria gallica]|uniref:Uncharacterized protein n=1 Tax=Armillaria gallica TaxID=47427 RepID=A0A2H3DTV7_ARMGA|nr:hypothetical protein ARMGADRAFT_1031985 [Armillaria gallica]
MIQIVWGPKNQFLRQLQISKAPGFFLDIWLHDRNCQLQSIAYEGHDTIGTQIEWEKNPVIGLWAVRIKGPSAIDISNICYWIPYFVEKVQAVRLCCGVSTLEDSHPKVARKGRHMRRIGVSKMAMTTMYYTGTLLLTLLQEKVLHRIQVALPQLENWLCYIGGNYDVNNERAVFNSTKLL